MCETSRGLVVPDTETDEHERSQLVPRQDELGSWVGARDGPGSELLDVVCPVFIFRPGRRRCGSCSERLVPVASLETTA